MREDAVDRVLLVDDDRVTNLLHERMIRKTGVATDVTVVSDGQRALEYMAKVSKDAALLPQIILLDLNMPRMNGFEFLEAYAEFSEDVKARQDVVMLTTSMLEQDRIRAAGTPELKRFVVKPLQTETLQAIFKEFHARRKKQAKDP